MNREELESSARDKKLEECVKLQREMEEAKLRYKIAKAKFQLANAECNLQFMRTR